MSHMTGTDGRSGSGRFGAATPGLRAERASIGDLVTAPKSSGRRRLITPWRVTALVVALLVAGGAYALGRYVIAPKPVPSVTLDVTTVALPAGARLTAGDLRAVTVQRSSAPKGALTPAGAASTIGLVARNAIPGGTFLASSLFSPAGGIPDATQALVGLALKAGQLPAGGLAVGQRVLVVLLPVTSSGVAERPVQLINTTVWDLQPPDSSGDQEVTVIVPSSMAANLSSFASRGEVSLVATSAPPAPSTRPSTGPTKPATHGHTSKGKGSHT
jgi:hypothetical protein